MMRSHQATCVALGGLALLIEGPPGSGKSSLALALIDRGAELIGDDGVLLAAENGRLYSFCHPETRGLLEVRNLGLLTYPVCESAPVGLLIRLDEAAPRFVDSADIVEIEGVSVTMLRLHPHSPALHLKAELALQRYGIAARTKN